MAVVSCRAILARYADLRARIVAQPEGVQMPVSRLVSVLVSVVSTYLDKAKRLINFGMDEVHPLLDFCFEFISHAV